jgi:hypothetical protein
VGKFKTIHFWKAYDPQIMKSDVSIFFDAIMVAILDFKMAA